MKNIFVICAVLLLTSCTSEAFRYNRDTACEINYGTNGISIIVDKDKVIVRNNRQIDYSNVLSVGTADRFYSMTGRYFSETDARDMVGSLKKSQMIYLKWRTPGGVDSPSNSFNAIVNVSNFATEFDKCTAGQKKL